LKLVNLAPLPDRGLKTAHQLVIWSQLKRKEALKVNIAAQINVRKTLATTDIG
jgi:hypothetical protein